jgi:hypothetical protein
MCGMCVAERWCITDDTTAAAATTTTTTPTTDTNLPLEEEKEAATKETKVIGFYESTDDDEGSDTVIDGNQSSDRIFIAPSKCIDCSGTRQGFIGSGTSTNDICTKFYLSILESRLQG